jgi:cobalt/nickel transport system permease protein
LEVLALDQWSRRDGPMHRRDPRAKTAALLFFLVLVATAHRQLLPLTAAWLSALALATAWARLPVSGLLGRAALVLPFSAVFASVTWFAGDAPRAAALVYKSYLSAAAVLLVVGTTPIPLLLRGLESVGVPRFLLMVMQFLYRYLFVIVEEAQVMRTAAAARGATVRGIIGQRARFRAGTGALAVLFARSYQRAEDVHRAMLARGFEGHFRALCQPAFAAADVLFVLAAAAGAAGLRIALERMAA